MAFPRDMWYPYDDEEDDEQYGELPAEEPWPEPYLPIDEETGEYYERRFRT
jgi:hypothetical protein